ncbi:replicative DNA helicase [Amedibacillus dolichus]|uniref:replicative DNA helicase n=1 Tax=Amedibacillus dolichus TaxID=31971 RepID=UPI001D026B40|nr:replicative DNA helicase [Amedibacillus dolichus]MCB5372944.1 replicative DNA helicase [Amedibacillus dolichus]
MSRELPHSNEAEQSLLGAMMIYPSVAAIAYDQGLEAKDFYLDIHKRIYTAMQDISDAGKPIDVTTLVSRLQDLEQLNLVGGADYIIKLSDTAISSANSSYYIDIIKSRAHLRRLIETAELIAEEGFDTASDLDEVMDKAEREILNVTRSRRATDFKSSRDVVSNVMQELMKLRSMEGHITGVKTGYTDLDRVTNGFQRGDLIILAARPAMGKTAFALNLALNASFYNSGAIAIFSLEMPAEALMKRILSAKSAVESSKLRSGNLRDDEFNKLNEAANELMATKLFVDDSSNVKISEVFSKCRKLRSEHGLDLVVIDYLQLISGSGRSSGDNRQQEISEISRSLKGLAREMECPVIALSQLSRSVETRPDKHPMLSDLRESGAIEQDADIVMFLYRDEYYNKDENSQEDAETTNTTDVDIAKHRNGATGRIQLAFQKNISAFYNIAHSDY